MSTTRLSNVQRARDFGLPGRVPTRLVQLPWVGVRTQCHEAIADRFLAACTLAAQRSSWVPRRCDGYNPRVIAGTKLLSVHSWALAWDFFATPPGVAPPGGVWTPTNPPDLRFYEPFLQLGFSLGALFTRRKDLPHIEWAGSRADAAIDWQALRAA